MGDNMNFWEENDSLAAAFKTENGYLLLDRREDGINYVFCDASFLKTENNLLRSSGSLFDAAMTLIENRDDRMKERIPFEQAAASFVGANYDLAWPDLISKVEAERSGDLNYNPFSGNGDFIKTD